MFYHIELWRLSYRPFLSFRETFMSDRGRSVSQITTQMYPGTTTIYFYDIDGEA